ncbi:MULTISPECIES: PP2C family protein-serine/threonine phosphatase [Streptomyces]|uniref:Protein phosphatase 2C domain-containing protein n=1 Tax=Streptomyces silvisoli TaxID=3034235 RepID=A0ABT5ZI99_9ACTN|nr:MULTISPECIES: protein phosphatase 2C domain-containing protein [Streptomyces]MDF3289563.1 protein phosphatase 2C domain-containing protein [Streptomyces silvisoli]
MAYIAVSALSHVGLVREHNEDSLAAGPWTLCGTVTDNPQTLLFPFGTPLVVAVADGLGGQPGGEVASALTVRRLSRVGRALDTESNLRDALKACNHDVYAAADANPALRTMGTTVAGVVVLPESALAFNIGDSRVLAVGQDGLRQLSVDDNPPLAPGQRTTNIVTQTLGGAVEFRDVNPHVRCHPLTEDARFLVCTDGLTDPVPDEELDSLLQEYEDGRAAFELWKAAIEAGGPDNITLAVVRIGEWSPRSP